MTALEEELQAKPDDAEIKMDLSDLVTVSGDYKRARSLAEQIVKAEPQNSKAWLILVKPCLSKLQETHYAVMPSCDKFLGEGLQYLGNSHCKGHALRGHCNK